jgi:hypothetical protein
VKHKIRTASDDGLPNLPGIAQIAEFVPKPILEL